MKSFVKSVKEKKNEKALISVSDKTNLVPFAQALIENGYEIISTGGTRNFLKQVGVQTTDIQEVTHFRNFRWPG